MTPISDDNSTVSIIFGLVMISQAHSMTWLANFRSIFIHLGFVKRTILNCAWFSEFFNHLYLWQTQIILMQKRDLWTFNKRETWTWCLLFTSISSWTWHSLINLAFWSQDCSHQKRPIRWYACFIQLIGDYAIHTNSPHSELYDVSHNWCNGEGML